MCLERTYYAVTARYSDVFFDALKPGQNEKSYIFQEIGIQLVALASQKTFEWLGNGAALGQNSLNSSGGNLCKNL